MIYIFTFVLSVMAAPKAPPPITDQEVNPDLVHQETIDQGFKFVEDEVDAEVRAQQNQVAIRSLAQNVHLSLYTLFGRPYSSDLEGEISKMGWILKSASKQRAEYVTKASPLEKVIVLFENNRAKNIYYSAGRYFKNLNLTLEATTTCTISRQKPMSCSSFTRSDCIEGKKTSRENAYTQTAHNRGFSGIQSIFGLKKTNVTNSKESFWEKEFCNYQTVQLDSYRQDVRGTPASTNSVPTGTR